MNKFLRFSLVLFLLLSVPMISCAQRDSVTLHKVSAEVFPGYVFHAIPFFAGEGTDFGATVSTHLKYSFQLGRNSDLGRMYPHCFQGVGLSCNSFFNSREIGVPTALYLFQNARIAALARNLSLNYEWNFGISYGWKKFDVLENPMNKVVGSKANAYINFGLVLDWEFAPMWSLTAGVGITHFSNGNTRYPNSGVNSVGGRVGVSRCFEGPGRVRAEGSASLAREEGFRRHMSYDLVLYGTSRKKAINVDSEPIIIAGNFGIIGVNFSPMYNVSRYFRVGASVDFQYDESANIEAHIPEGAPMEEEMKFYRPPFIEQGSLGLSVRGELVMPIFSINAGLGRNVVCRGKDTDGWYTIFALKADLWRGCFLHIGYQLYNFKNPNNLMLGIGYRFNNGRAKARRQVD